MAEQNINNLNNDFLIIWVDDSIEKSTDNLDTKQYIRRLVRGHLATFDQSENCIDFFFTKNTAQKVSLIVSNRFGDEVVSTIHDSPLVQKIYVYCCNRQRAEEWIKPYTKVCGIFTTKQLLLNKLCEDTRTNDPDDIVPFSVFHLDERQQSIQNLTQESATFMWYRSILSVLLLTAKYCDAKIEMIKECRANYPNDEAEQKKITDFEKAYEPKEAFKWYTLDSFVYRLLNQALRTQNTEIIFTFRFFINDLHNQIVKRYQEYLRASSSSDRKRLTLYRGQRMNMAEVEHLRHNIGEVISMNSFFSTTSIREIAEIFADTGDQVDEKSPLQSVIFFIDIRDINKETTPFAHVDDYSCCSDEQEVLFTIGAIFKVESVKQEGKKWLVNLQLTKQQNEHYKDLFRKMMKQVGNDPGAISFGWFLYRMSEFAKAERYAEMVIERFPANDIEIGNAYNLLGLINKDLKRHKKSIECYAKALDIYSRLGQHDSPHIIMTHYNLGLVCLESGDIQNAHEHRKQAKAKLINSSYKKDKILVTTLNCLTTKLQAASGDYVNAFKNFEVILRAKENELGPDHPSITSTLNDMGIVQEKMGNDHKALSYFNRALEIRQKCLPPNHLDVAECLINIARIHDKRRDHELAAKHNEKATKIIQNAAREEEAG